LNIKYLIFSLLITYSIVFLSSIPDQSLPGDGSLTGQIISNLAHIPAYGLLTYAWLKSFAGVRNMGRRSVVNLALLIGLMLFAMSDEIHQSFVPGRSASPIDFALDATGIALGFSLLLVLQRRGHDHR
jgi:VanZ family protein